MALRLRISAIRRTGGPRSSYRPGPWSRTPPGSGSPAARTSVCRSDPRALPGSARRAFPCPPPALRRLLKSLRYGQEPAFTKLRDEGHRVPLGPLRVHVELLANPGDDRAHRGLAVRRLPDQRPDRVQAVQRAVVRAEDGRLAVVDPPRCPGTLRQIRLRHCGSPPRTVGRAEAGGRRLAGPRRGPVRGGRPPP